MSQRNPTARDRTEHSYCLQLQQSAAFAFFLDELQKPLKIAMRETCAPNPASRDYEAGRLSAFAEASELVAKKYNELKKIVEVIPS